MNRYALALILSLAHLEASADGLRREWNGAVTCKILQIDSSDAALPFVLEKRVTLAGGVGPAAVDWTSLHEPLTGGVFVDIIAAESKISHPEAGRPPRYVKVSLGYESTGRTFAEFDGKVFSLSGFPPKDSLVSMGGQVVTEVTQGKKIATQIDCIPL